MNKEKDIETYIRGEVDGGSVLQEGLQVMVLI